MISPELLYEVPKVSAWLLIAQLFAMVTVTVQGYYWFSIILLKDISNYKKSAKVTGSKEI